MRSRTILVICGAFLIFGLFSGCTPQAPKGGGSEVLQPYGAKDYSRLFGMPGFSDTLLQTHFKLYQGYVNNTNTLLDKLRALSQSQATETPEFSELRRRLGFEFNGMRLHEYYFDNLGGPAELSPQGELYDAIVKNFGTFDAWKRDFTAAGSTRGIGWVILYSDPQSGRLINFWINEHETNHPAGCRPLLVMDAWEHAYMPDYLLERSRYIDAFLKNIDWKVVEARYQFGRLPSAEQPPEMGDVSSESLRSFGALGQESKTAPQ